MALEHELADPRVEAMGMLMEAHAEVVNAVSRDLAGTTDAPVPWIGVLLRLARTPDQQLRMTELARDMTISTSGLTRLVDRIEAAGHVERRTCPEDRRGLWCRLTPAGRAELERVLPRHLEVLDAVVGTPFDDGEIVQLTDLLRRLRDHVRSSPRCQTAGP